MALVKTKTTKLYQRKFVCFYLLCAILFHVATTEDRNSSPNDDSDKLMNTSNDSNRNISTDVNKKFPADFPFTVDIKDINIQLNQPPPVRNRTDYYKTKYTNEDSPVKDEVSLFHKTLLHPEVEPWFKLGQGRFDLPNENFKPKYKSYRTGASLMNTLRGLGLSAGGAAVGGIAYCKWCRKKHSGRDDNSSLTIVNEEFQDDTTILIPECEEEHEMNSPLTIENEESQDDSVILNPNTIM